MPKTPPRKTLTWPRSGSGLRRLLLELDDRRGSIVREHKAERGGRGALSRSKRQKLLAATGKRCHVCGGRIRGDRWVADHVFNFASGGTNDLTNFLPAHRDCNGYKWFYSSKELRWMLRMAIWARGRMIRETKFDDEILGRFWAWELRRRQRRSLKEA